MVTKEMIIIEDRLKEIFEYLPDVPSMSGDTMHKPVFHYGDNKQLLDFLKQNNRGNKPYPLIWLVYPYSETHNRSNVEFTGLTLILAVETNAVMLNTQRMRETYEKVLIPLYNNITYALQRANISNRVETFEVTKFPNYSDVSSTGDENQATYIWDALRVSFDGYFNSNCLRPIIFN